MTPSPPGRPLPQQEMQGASKRAGYLCALCEVKGRRSTLYRGLPQT